MTITEAATNQGLDITVTEKAGETVVGLSGRVTVDSSPALRDQLLALLKRSSLPALTLDLPDLTYIDCSGIATLIEALRIANQRKTKLQLRGLRDGPRRLLEVTGLLRLFDTNGGTDHSSASKVP